MTHREPPHRPVPIPSGRGRSIGRGPAVVAAVVVALATLLVAGCTSSKDASAPAASEPGSSTPGTVAAAAASYAPAPCPAPSVPGYPQFDLGPGFTCGYLTVPENRSVLDGPTIRLLVATLAATSPAPAPDPIVWLTGGAGSPIVADANVAKDLGINADRDVVFIEQRGNYSSEPALTCPEDAAFNTTLVTESFLDPATREQSKAATKACRDRLAGSGIDLAAYSTAENASDVADLRVALGFDEWNLYGYSYGTLLALTVLRDHPAGVRSVVLDSVVPPNRELIEEFWPAAAAGYQAIFDGCAAQPSCAAAYPDLADEFVATVNRLTTAPVTVPVADPATGAMVPVVIDGYKFANLLVQLGGVHEYFSEVPAVVHELAGGDGSQVAELLVELGSSPPIGGKGLSLGVYCPEYAAHTDAAAALARAEVALPGFPDAVLGHTPQLPLFENCPIWDVGKAPDAVHAAVRSDVPVLLMAGTFDTITAVSWIDKVAPGLASSQTVVVPGVGHETIKSGPCPLSVMNEFLAAPTAPVDRTCIDALALPTFTTP